MAARTHRRRQRLIKPGLQLKLIATFAGLTVLGLLLQYVLLAKELTGLADTLPVDGPRVLSEAPGMLGAVLAVSFGVVFPLTVVVGVLVTFRIAGPVYRFEQYLRDIARGEDRGERCRIRKGDELWELCETINDAVDALRADASEKAGSTHDVAARAHRRTG